MFQQLGQQCSESVARAGTQLQGSATRLHKAAATVLQESAAAKAIQNSATRLCAACSQRFVRTNVFTCEECQQPTCRGCFVRLCRFNPSGEYYGLSSSGKKVDVCKTCEPAAQERTRGENVEERMKRAQAFLEYRLEPYRYSVESKMEQSYRLGSKVVQGMQKVVGFLPLGITAEAIKVGAYIVRYGPLVAFGNDIIMALQYLVILAMQLEIPALTSSLPHDLFGGFYYMMGEQCAERGKAPELERQEHVDDAGAVPAPGQELLMELRRLARILLVTTYWDNTPTDTQRLLRHVLPGSELVVGELSDTPQVPSYFLTCTRRDKRAYLLLPGTRNASDVATDVNAKAEAVPGGKAHRGMVSSARWLLGEVGPILRFFIKHGYRVVIVGHSLGAAVASLLTAFLRPDIPSLQSYCFGTPACVDEELMVGLLDCVVSVVNRDDIIPRLTVQSVQCLVEHALCPGQRAKTKAWMDEDWKALKNIERIVELRRRDGKAADAQPKSPSAEATSQDDEKVRRLCAAGVSREAAVRALEAEAGDPDAALLRAAEEEVGDPAELEPPPQEGGSPSSLEQAARHEEAAPLAPTPLAGPGPGLWQGVWGELQRLGTRASTALAPPRPDTDAAQAPEEPPPAQAPRQASKDLPHFVIPGQVIHLYQQNGLSRAAVAPCTHDALRQIQLMPGMVEDHTMKAYDRALLQACIQAPRTPRWESFEERRVCACCEADFNWAYVLKSEPQQNLARVHCFSCGRVVCDGCSKNRQAHERLGLRAPVRTCDSCFFSCD